MTLGADVQRYPIGLGFAKAPKEIIFSPAVTGLDGSAFGAEAFRVSSDTACVLGPVQGTGMFGVALTASIG